MKFIAHRGLLEGPNSELENHPYTIEKALAMGIDVETDAWLINGDWYLGHDKPQYPIHQSFLERSDIWVHCKNAEALYGATPLMHYFSHNTDDFTLTSRGIIWAYPGKMISSKKKVVAVLPEMVSSNYVELIQEYKKHAFAICTDYVLENIDLK